MRLFQTRATEPKDMQRRLSRRKQLTGTIVSLAGSTVIRNDRPSTYINDGYMFNPDVYSVINIITRAASAVPPLVLEVTDEKKAREYYRFKYSQRNGVGKDFQKKQAELRAKAFEEVDESDDLYKHIDRPNPLQGWPEFVENLLGFLEITGNGFSHGVELSDGRFSELWVMPSHLTSIKAGRSIESLISGYLLQYNGDQVIDPETVLHVKYWNPDYSSPGSHLYGMSPLRSAMSVVRSGNDGMDVLSASYKNLGASGMTVAEDKNVGELAQAQRDALQRDIQYAAGPKYSKSVLVTSVKMGWQNFGLARVDMEILSALNLSLRKICNIYGVSSELLNAPENKTQANKRETRRSLYMEHVIPKMERIFSELNRWVVPRFEAANGKKYHLDYDVSGIEALADDMAKKVDWLSQAWWLTPDEKRQAIDYPESDNPRAQQMWAPMGRMPIGDLSPAEMALRELRANYGRKDG